MADKERSKMAHNKKKLIRADKVTYRDVFRFWKQQRANITTDLKTQASFVFLPQKFCGNFVNFGIANLLLK